MANESSQRLCNQATGPPPTVAKLPPAVKNQKTTAPRRGISLPRRPYTGAPTPLAIGASVALCCIFVSIGPVAHATTAIANKPTFPRTALGGFIKDRALARVLGEMLFQDTVDVMSDAAVQLPSAPPPSVASPSATAQAAATTAASPSAAALAAGTTAASPSATALATGTPVAGTSTAATTAATTPDPWRDNSAAGQVARTVLAHRTLDKYLWLIQQAYADTLWRGGDRTRIEQHFPLIWRTSIMLYEATLNASPHRVRVCTPADDGDGFDCRDEIERAKIVPIPAQAPIIGGLHQPAIG